MRIQNVYKVKFMQMRSLLNNALHALRDHNVYVPYTRAQYVPSEYIAFVKFLDVEDVLNELRTNGIAILQIYVITRYNERDMLERIVHILENLYGNTSRITYSYASMIVECVVSPMDIPTLEKLY